MKPKFGREIALLTLPILIIGGVTWLGAGSGRALLPAFLKLNPFNIGPLRVEFSSLRPVVPQPLDVARGIDWAAETTAEQFGKWDVPPGWKQSVSLAATPSVKLVYRIGKVWTTVMTGADDGPVVVIHSNGDTNLTTFKVDLQSVPRDADEVRLRGEFRSSIYYTGPLTSGWKPPKNLRISGVNRILEVESKPFDVQIKGPGEPLPTPDVSRTPEVELKGAAWFTEVYSYGNRERFFLLLRHTTQRKWPARAPRVQKVRVFDATGRELLLFDKDGTGKYRFSEAASVFNQRLFSSEMPQNEFVAPIFSDDTAPRGGWSRVKQPIRVEMEISDGQCWPLKTRITLRHETAFDEKKFGAPEASKIP